MVSLLAKRLTTLGKAQDQISRGLVGGLFTCVQGIALAYLSSVPS